MRISHVDVANGAARRLKALLPSLGGVPGSVQAELFIIYSSLKYLGMELERGIDAGAAKTAAADALIQALQPLLDAPVSSAFQPAGAEPLTDRRVDVAAILDLVRASDVPEGVEEQVMEHLSKYLFDINQIDLDVYR